MYYVMCYIISIGGYSLQAIDSVTIMKSVENLADTATIVIPGTYINRSIQIEDKIKEGDAVEIRLGYNDALMLEFRGYVDAISTDNSTIRIDCIDALYLFKKPLANREYKNIPLKNLLKTVADEVNRQNKEAGAPTRYVVDCDYGFDWKKFVFFKATAFDVLKKIQDETKANIYFKDEVLHIHSPYSEITNREPVIYDFAQNIEKSDLKYVLLKNKKIEIVVSSTQPDGKTKKVAYGNTGGEKHFFTSNGVSDSSMKTLAQQKYNLFAYDGYEGHFTGWLMPFVEPAYKIRLRDKEYPYKDGDYYVISVETKFGGNGGSRTVTLGRRLS